MTPFEALEFLGCCLSAGHRGPGSPSELKHRITGPAVDWPAIVKVADGHYVLPLLYGTLQAKNLFNLLPQDLQDTLSTLYRLNHERTIRLKSQLGQTLRVLNAIGVAPVLLKGAAVHFSKDLYPDPACRMMNDLDLLVPPKRLQDGIEALAAVGYGPMEESELPGWHYHSPPLVHPDHIARLELHRELFIQPYTRLLDAESVLKHAVPVDREGLRYRLCTVLHSAMHNIIEHQLLDKLYYRRTFYLYKICDLVRLMQTVVDEAVWRELFLSFKREGYGRAAAVYFMLARRIFHQPIPPGIDPPSHARAEWRLIRALWAPPPAIAYYLEMAAYISQHPDFARIFLRQLFQPESYVDSLKRLTARMRGTG